MQPIGKLGHHTHSPLQAPAVPSTAAAAPVPTAAPLAPPPPTAPALAASTSPAPITSAAERDGRAWSSQRATQGTSKPPTAATQSAQKTSDFPTADGRGAVSQRRHDEATHATVVKHEAIRGMRQLAQESGMRDRDSSWTDDRPMSFEDDEKVRRLLSSSSKPGSWAEEADALQPLQPVVISVPRPVEHSSTGGGRESRSHTAAQSGSHWATQHGVPHQPAARKAGVGDAQRSEPSPTGSWRQGPRDVQPSRRPEPSNVDRQNVVERTAQLLKLQSEQAAHPVQRTAPAPAPAPARPAPAPTPVVPAPTPQGAAPVIALPAVTPKAAAAEAPVSAEMLRQAEQLLHERAELARQRREEEERQRTERAQQRAKEKLLQLEQRAKSNPPATSAAAKPSAAGDQGDAAAPTVPKADPAAMPGPAQLLDSLDWRATAHPVTERAIERGHRRATVQVSSREQSSAKHNEPPSGGPSVEAEERHERSYDQHGVQPAADSRAPHRIMARSTVAVSETVRSERSTASEVTESRAAAMQPGHVPRNEAGTQERTALPARPPPADAVPVSPRSSQVDRHLGLVVRFPGRQVVTCVNVDEQTLAHDVIDHLAQCSIDPQRLPKIPSAGGDAAHGRASYVPQTAAGAAPSSHNMQWLQQRPMGAAASPTSVHVKLPSMPRAVQVNVPAPETVPTLPSAPAQPVSEPVSDGSLAQDRARAVLVAASAAAASASSVGSRHAAAPAAGVAATVPAGKSAESAVTSSAYTFGTHHSAATGPVDTAPDAHERDADHAAGEHAVAALTAPAVPDGALSNGEAAMDQQLSPSISTGGYAMADYGAAYPESMYWARMQEFPYAPPMAVATGFPMSAPAMGIMGMANVMGAPDAAGQQPRAAGLPFPAGSVANAGVGVPVAPSGMPPAALTNPYAPPPYYGGPRMDMVGSGVGGVGPIWAPAMPFAAYSPPAVRARFPPGPVYLEHPMPRIGTAPVAPSGSPHAPAVASPGSPQSPSTAAGTDPAARATTVPAGVLAAGKPLAVQPAQPVPDVATVYVSSAAAEPPTRLASMLVPPSPPPPAVLSAQTPPLVKGDVQPSAAAARASPTGGATRVSSGDPRSAVHHYHHASDRYRGGGGRHMHDRGDSRRVVSRQDDRR